MPWQQWKVARAQLTTTVVGDQLTVGGQECLPSETRTRSSALHSFDRTLFRSQIKRLSDNFQYAVPSAERCCRPRVLAGMVFNEDWVSERSFMSRSTNLSVGAQTSAWQARTTGHHVGEWRQTKLMTYRCLHGQAPRYLADHVTPAIEVASRHRLRSANRHRLIVPRCLLNTYGRRAFPVTGPTVWNSLPDELRDPACDVDSFKQFFKTILLLVRLAH